MPDMLLLEICILSDHLCKVLPVHYVSTRPIAKFCVFASFLEQRFLVFPLDINIDPFTSDTAVKVLAGQSFDAAPTLWRAPLAILQKWYFMAGKCKVFVKDMSSTARPDSQASPQEHNHIQPTSSLSCKRRTLQPHRFCPSEAFS